MRLEAADWIDALRQAGLYAKQRNASEVSSLSTSDAAQAEAAHSSDEPPGEAFSVPVDPNDLIPVLDRAGDMGPLAVVLALIPVLVAWQQGSLTWLDSLWYLRARWMLHEAGSPPSGSLLSFFEAPPLGTWLQSLILFLPEPLRLRCLLVPSWAAAFCFVCAAYLVVRTTLGPRTALLCTALLAIHPFTLQMAQDVSPVSWGLPAGLLVFWAAARSLQHPDRHAFGDLATIAICLALCLLAGGPVASAVLVAVVLLCTLELFGWSGVRRCRPSSHSGGGLHQNRPLEESGGGGSRIGAGKSRGVSNEERRPLAWRQLAARIIWILAASFSGWAIGGVVWALRSVRVGGRIVLPGLWASGLVPSGSGLPATTGSCLAAQITTTLVGPLAGLVLLGLTRAVLQWRVESTSGAVGGQPRTNGSSNRGFLLLGTRSESLPVAGTVSDAEAALLPIRLSPTFRGTEFMLLWLAVGVVFLVAFESAGDLAPAWSDLWQRFLLVPVTTFAAQGLNALLRRRFEVRAALLVVVLTVVIVIVDQLRHVATRAGALAYVLWLVVVGAVTTFALFRVEKLCRGSRRRERWCAGAAVLLILSVYASVALVRSQHLAPPAGAEIEALAARLSEWKAGAENTSATGRATDVQPLAMRPRPAIASTATDRYAEKKVSGVKLSAARKLAERLKTMNETSQVYLVGPIELVVPLGIVIDLTDAPRSCRAFGSLSCLVAWRAEAKQVAKKQLQSRTDQKERKGSRRPAFGQDFALITVGRFVDTKEIAQTVQVLPVGPPIQVDSQWAQVWLIRWED